MIGHILFEIYILIRCLMLLLQILVTFPPLTADNVGWIADDIAIVGYILGDNGASSNADIVAHFNISDNRYIYTDVDIVSDIRASLRILFTQIPESCQLTDGAILADMPGVEICAQWMPKV